MRTFPTLLLMVCLAPSGMGQDTTFQKAWHGVTLRLQKHAAEHGVVGSSLAFYRRGKRLAEWQHGLADIETSRKVDRNTIFHWASITKTFTVIALLQLRDRGRISMDDPILRYLPELKKVHNPFGKMQDITLAHLASHSAGFRNPTWPWGGQDKTSWQPHEPTSWQQIVAMLPYTKIAFRPGSRYSYSNLGIIFLGRVIEIESGEGYEVYVEKNVLRPLGMRRSYFDHTPYHLLGSRSNNYYLKDKKPVANGLDFDTGITVANGGLNGPLPDMGRYLGFLSGFGDKDALAVLKPKSLAEMWQPRLKVSTAGELKTSMGLGFFVLEQGPRRYVGHTGGQKGFISFIYMHPESGTAAVAAFNTGSARPVLARLREDLFQNVFPLFPDL